METEVISNPGLTIKEMSDIFGITYRTLRFYEDFGLLSPMRFGNARFYSTRDRIRVDLIAKGKRLGFSLREIRDLILHKDTMQKEDASLFEKIDRQEIESRIKDLCDKRSEIEEAITVLKAALPA